jgi:hypothetical protein
MRAAAANQSKSTPRFDIGVGILWAGGEFEQKIIQHAETRRDGGGQIGIFDDRLAFVRSDRTD